MRKPLSRPNKHFVAIPNEFFNGWLKELEPSETHLLNFIMRKILGYRKEEDWITISQFVKDTKLSKPTIQKCLKSLEKKEMIFKKQTGKGRGIKTYWKLNIEGNGAKNEPLIESNGKEICPLTESNGKEILSEMVKNFSGNGKEICPTKDMYTKDIFTKDIYIHIFEHWNTKNIIKHSILTDKMKVKIKSALKDYPETMILSAINNYAEVIAHPETYFFSYRWTLADFLQRGLSKFLNEAKPLENFLHRKKPEEIKKEALKIIEKKGTKPDLQSMTPWERQDYEIELEMKERRASGEVDIDIAGKCFNKRNKE